MNSKIRKVSLMLLVVFCSSILNIQAQDDDEKTSNFKFSLGVNVLDPMLSIVKKQEADSSQLIAPNIYADLGFKHWHLRAGFGGELLERNNKSDLTDNISKETRYKYAFTASLLYRKELNEKWAVAGGAFFWSQYYLNETAYDSGFDLTTNFNEYIAYAGGPGGLISYQINKRLSLFTEYALLYRLEFQNQGRIFSAFPNENFKKHSATIRSINFQHPLTIFLNYNF